MKPLTACYLTTTMLALCSALAAAEPAPPGDGKSPLDTYANERDAHLAGPREAAAFLFARGMRAREENRLAEAVKDLTQAVDYQPTNAAYRKELATVRALAGLERDPRSLQIDRLVDEVQVRQQELWNEAQTKKEQGVKAMETGDFNLADRCFQMALVRLESLPFPDERTASAKREIETLATVARTRREAKDRDDAAARNRAAQDRSRELLNLGLQLERDRLDAMLRRALRARERRDYDEAILICEQVLKINRAEAGAAELLARCRRERHVYVRQMTADRWDEEHKLTSESIRTSMLPQLELVRYTTEWPELDARRTAPVHGLEEKQDAWRKQLMDQLDKEITLDFSDTDLADVVAFLQKVSDANIVLDNKVAATSKVVSIRVEKMKLSHVLKHIMTLTQLSYALRNEAIFISNSEGVRGDLFMKLYDVRDLTHGMSSFPGPSLEIPEPGGTGSRLLPPIEAAAKPETTEFMDIIQKVVSPATWAAGQGASIEQFNGSMVVNQTAEVHTQIDVLLRALRNQRGSQIHVKCKFLSIENSMLEQIGVSWQNYNRPTIGTTPDISTASNTQPNNVVQANSVGAAWGENRFDQVVTAGRINNQLLNYATASGIPAPAGSDGLSLQGTTWQVASSFYASAILTAVEKERRGNVAFEPDITLFNGQQAHIVNMNQQSYISDYDIVQSNYDPIISILSYGTVLDVQGIVSADKKFITLTLRPTNAQVRRWRRFGPPIPGGTFGGGTVDPGGGAVADSPSTSFPLIIPEISYSAVRTSVTIPDGGSLVIAGMTNGESSRSHAGVPFLSHIPFLGRLFSSNGRAETELRQLIVVQADLILFDEIEKKL